MTSSARTKRGNAALNPACFPVLAIVADGPIHGYDISRTLRSEIGQLWRLGKSQVYALLVKLEKAGLVQHERIGQDAYPAKNVFTITETGRMVLNDWAIQPVHHIRDMRLEFPVKLWFARKMGDQHKEQLIQSQLEICNKKTRTAGSSQGVGTAVRRETNPGTSSCHGSRGRRVARVFADAKGGLPSSRSRGGLSQRPRF